MAFAFSHKTEEYYKTFIELQEKLRKSEEERLKLEMRFNEMMRITKEEEQTHYRKLRNQYKRFLEEDRRRQDRNERLLRTLEKIESRISMLVAKTERFKLLRQQYNKYLERIYDAKHVKITEPPVPKQQETKDEGDILKTYLETLSSQRVKDQLVNIDSSKKSRLPFSLTRDSSDDLKIDYEDNFQGDCRPNYANSIADDIINSMYSRPSKKSFDIPAQKRELNNNLFKSKDLPLRSDFKVDSSVDGASEENDDDDLYLKTRSEDRDSVKEFPVSPQVKKDSGLGDVKETQEAPSEVTPKGVKVDELQEETQEIYDKNAYQSQFDQPNREKDTVQETEREHQSIEACNQHLVDSVQPIERLHQQYSERAESIESQHQQHSESAQPIEAQNDENLQSIEIQNRQPTEIENQQYDGNVQPIDMQHQQQSKNGHPIEIQNDNVQPIEMQTQQCVDNGPPIDIQHQEYGENAQAIEVQNQQFDDNVQPIEMQSQQYDDNGQPIDIQHQEYGENAQAIEVQNQQYDENGQPIEFQNQPYDESAYQQYDENGQPIEIQGQYIQEYDANTQQYFQQYDENGQPIQQYDQYIQQYDENGQPIDQYGYAQQYDENGQVIQQQYDENGQIIQQYDQDYYAENAYEFPETGTDGNDQQIAENAGGIIGVGDNGEEHETADLSISERHDGVISKPNESEREQVKVEEEKKNITEEPKKISNVIDMLDTDTESAQQDTKASNESDFDFSNG